MGRPRRAAGRHAARSTSGTVPAGERAKGSGVRAAGTQSTAEDPLVELELGHEQIRERRRLPAPSLSALLGVAVLVLIAAAAVHLSLRGSAVPEESATLPPAAPVPTEQDRSAGADSVTGQTPPDDQPEREKDGPEDAGSGSERVDEPAQVVVHVSGAVDRPGVVSVTAPARVDDAVRAAGGATDEADLSALNLARLLEDGEQVHVPRPGEAPPAAAGAPRTGPESSGGGADGEDAPGSPGDSGAIDINTASASQLEELPGVGPAIAERIISHREANGPYRSAEDLLDVSGIGPATLEKMRDRVAVGG